MMTPSFSYADPSQPWHVQAFIRLIERLTGQPELERLYLENQHAPRQGESFWAAAVRHLNLRPVLTGFPLLEVPKTGPLVAVANHPFGVLDGIVMCWLMEQIRPDFKVLTNAVLLKAPEARPFLIPIDFEPTAQAHQTNLASRDAARRHLADGGSLILFPAGGVSTAPDRWGRMLATDAPWQPFTAQLIERSQATVLPVLFDGQNSRLFQIASHLNQHMRVALIFREVRRRMGSQVPMRVGPPIRFADMPKGLGRKGLAQWLCDQTYGLGPVSP